MTVVTATEPAAGELAAHAHRFRLHRAGISNIWQYDDQVFQFEGGRLLLRGKNGAGKSKALELLLPFLLDGDTRRLDATGAGRTTFRWLMSEGAAGVNRQGFAWLELRRVDESGVERYLTLGAIVRWSSSTAEARITYLVTPLRVGIDVTFVVDRQPVPIARLREILGDGSLLNSARDYRARVGREVFGIADPGRYRNLVHLLYRLRRPTIGDRIEAGQLTLELNEALPPLDDEVLDSVAHNLDDLEAVRADLGRLEATHSALSELMTGYRGYLHGELRQRIRAVDEALADLRAWRRRSGEAERQVDAAQATERALRSALNDLELDERRARAELGALRESSGYRAVQELAQRRLAVEALHAAATSAERATAADRQTVHSVVERLLAETERLATTVAGLRDAHRQLRELATGAGLDVGHLGAVPELREQAAPADPAVRVLDHQLAATGFAAYRTGVNAAAETVRSRRKAVADLRRLLDESEAADRDAARAEADRELLDGQQSAAQNRFEQVTAELVAASGAFAHGVRQWLSRPALNGAHLAPVQAALLTEEPLPPETPAEVRAAAEDAVEPLRAAAQGRRDVLLTERSRTRDSLDGVVSEHRRWSAVTDPEPPASRFRRSELPAGAGVPLYRLVDFADHLDDGQRAGLEAGLESSGLLDGMVSADGGTLDVRDGEVILRPAATVAGPTLSDVLVPVPGSDHVAPLLAGIGLGPATGAATWVSDDGRWRLDIAHGRWQKPAAEYVGAASRERLRRRRLAELEHQRDDVTARLETIEERLTVEETVQAELTAALRRLPDGVDLRTAWGRQDEAESAVSRLARQVAEARRRARELRATAETRRKHAHAAATAHLLPDNRADLTVIDQRLRQLGADLPRHGSDTERFLDQLGPYGLLITQHEDACARAAHTADEASAAAETHFAAAQAYAVLERSLGAEPAEILRQEADAEARIRDCEVRTPAVRRDHEQARDARVRSEENRDHARSQLTAQENVALASGTALPRVLTLPGVAEALGLGGETPMETGIGTPRERIRLLDQLATQLREALDHPRHDVGENALHQRYNDVRNRLPGGYDLLWEDRDGIKVVELADDIGQHPIATATQRLGDDLDQKRSAVAEREQHAFERFLLGELGDALSRQVRSAEVLVAAMNATLVEVRTSHGLGARLIWALRDDAGADVRTAVTLLATPAALRTRESNDRLRQALASRVEDARRADPSAGYAVHLRAALDYRQWFGFTVKVTDQANPERERTLSTRTAMSQGEQRVVSYLVLFAAAAAHFTSVGDTYPNALRLILLDDAFAKVDEPTHGRLLGLLVDLDLDAVLTSERLWGCFPEVPSLGIYECLRDPAQPGVATLHFRWDGRRRTVLTA